VAERAGAHICASGVVRPWSRSPSGVQGRPRVFAAGVLLTAVATIARVLVSLLPAHLHRAELPCLNAGGTQDPCGKPPRTCRRSGPPRGNRRGFPAAILATRLW
jgi:hypothetical protein